MSPGPMGNNGLHNSLHHSSDPLLGLLNLRNIPRYQVLGSPAWPDQWLMPRRTKCGLPVKKKLLIPKVLNTRHVSSRMNLKRQQLKSYTTICMPNLSYLSIHSKLCHFRLTKGKKVGVVKQPAPQEAEQKQYCIKKRTSPVCPRTSSC